MNLHNSARTTPHSRLLMVRRMLERQQPAARVAAAFRVSEAHRAKWLPRWRASGEPALNDRSSRPVLNQLITPLTLVPTSYFPKNEETSW
jgi:hypothetical protein